MSRTVRAALVFVASGMLAFGAATLPALATGHSHAHNSALLMRSVGFPKEEGKPNLPGTSRHRATGC